MLVHDDLHDDLVGRLLHCRGTVSSQRCPLTEWPVKQLTIEPCHHHSLVKRECWSWSDKHTKSIFMRTNMLKLLLLTVLFLPSSSGNCARWHSGLFEDKQLHISSTCPHLHQSTESFHSLGTTITIILLLAGHPSFPLPVRRR
jgi:hypothetical protein